MLNDLNPKEFRNIYIVCGATDMRYGINGLSAIIEQKYKMNVFIGKTLFMFCGHNAKIMKAANSLYNSGHLLMASTACSELYSEYFSFCFIYIFYAVYKHSRKFFP